MTAHHLFADDVSSSRIEIGGEDARHAVRVLRVRPGERVTISDGAGSVVDATVVDAGRSLTADVTARRSVAKERPSITVVQGIPKGSKLEQITQHLVELGVDEIVPLRARRSIARWESEAKLTRLRAIAREASKQSRRAWLPRVADPVDVATAPLGDAAFVLHEEAGRGLWASLPGGAPDRLTLLVGPEGGFDPAEVSALEARGARSAGLGPLILRTETAPVVATALVLARFGRLG